MITNPDKIHNWKLTNTDEWSHIYHSDYIGEQFINKALAEHIRHEARVAERQFILNVLDGVDLADGTCTTKAIRYALSTRVL